MYIDRQTDTRTTNIYMNPCTAPLLVVAQVVEAEVLDQIPPGIHLGTAWARRRGEARRSRVNPMSALKNGVVALEKGVLALEKGVLALENGVVTLEKGVVALEKGVFALETGVLVLEKSLR